MNHASHIAYGVAGLRALAWVCLSLCVAVALLAGAVAFVTSGRSNSWPDPLPPLRWEDVAKH